MDVRKQWIKQLLLYGIIGVVSAGLDALLFRILVYNLHWHSLLANCVSVVAGILTSFTLNLHFNFKTKDRVWVRFASFFAVGMVGLLISSGILAFGGWMEWDAFMTKLASIVLVAAIQFVLNKLISFKPTEEMDIHG